MSVVTRRHYSIAIRECSEYFCKCEVCVHYYTFISIRYSFLFARNASSQIIFAGQIGFLLCSENVDLDLDMINPKKKLMHNCIGDEEMKKLRYYCESIHHAAFVLPKFAQELLKN